MKRLNKFIIFSACAIVVLSLAAFVIGNKMSGENKSGIKTEPLPVYNTSDFTPMWITEDNKDSTFHTISDFKFTDQNGAAFGSAELKDKIYAVDFFFSSCPGICPKLTANFEKIQNAYKNDPRVMLVSFSVTPERDSTSILRNYAAGHNVDYGKWRLLTGNRKSIYLLARQSFFADEDLGLQADENTFLHTENVLLIDSKGRIRGVYKGTYGYETDKLINEIKLLETDGTK